MVHLIHWFFLAIHLHKEVSQLIQPFLTLYCLNCLNRGRQENRFNTKFRTGLIGINRIKVIAVSNFT